MKIEDIRDLKLDSVLENKSISIKYTHLDSGIVAFTQKPPKEITSGKIFSKIETDYFGGFGEQSAVIFDNGLKKPVDSINDALKIMGVKKKSGMDEFDTIGLGNYRSNEDFK